MTNQFQQNNKNSSRSLLFGTIALAVALFGITSSFIVPMMIVFIWLPAFALLIGFGLPALIIGIRDYRNGFGNEAKLGAIFGGISVFVAVALVAYIIFIFLMAGLAMSGNA